MLGLRQPWVCSICNFIFLALAYENRWPFLSLALSSSHRQRTHYNWVSYRYKRCRNLEPNFYPDGDLNPNLTTGSPAGHPIQTPSSPYVYMNTYSTYWSLTRLKIRTTNQILAKGSFNIFLHYFQIRQSPIHQTLTQRCPSPLRQNDAYCILPPISQKNINFSPPYFCEIYDFCLIYIFGLPLFWPWCIYASCFTRTGCSCTHYQFPSQQKMQTELMRETYDLASWLLNGDFGW